LDDAIQAQRLRRYQHRAGQLGRGSATGGRGNLLADLAGGSVERIAAAFGDFERLFNGQFPGYLGCDTVYHDLQHSLDDTLAMARLLAGYDKSHAPDQRLGADRAVMGIVVALFHDAGYIRQTDDTQHRNGAEFTRTHVSRSANFLARYLRRSAWRSGCRSRRRSCTSLDTS